MKAKHEQIQGESPFYCFVDFENEADDAPTTYVIPSDIVAEALELTQARRAPP